MKWLGFLFLLSMTPVLLPAQPPTELERFLRAGEFDRARDGLVRVLRDAGDGAPRGGILDRWWPRFRGVGASASLLEALDTAVAEYPEDVVLRYYRASLEGELKLHARSRADFAVVVAADPSQKWQLARLASQAFRHEEAASLSRDLEGAEWKSFHGLQSRLASSLDVAALRQQIGLFVSAALFVGFLLALRRRLTPPEA